MLTVGTDAVESPSDPAPETHGRAPKSMKNLAHLDLPSVPASLGNLGLASPTERNPSDRDPKLPPAVPPPAGSAAAWWDAHPAQVPQSTVLWIEDDTPGRPARGNTGSDSRGGSGTPRCNG